MPITRTYNCIHCGKLNAEKRSGSKYCDNQCQAEYQSEVIVESWLRGERTISRKQVRRWLVKTFGDKCNCCGITEWNGKPITLWVDHIDGDATNNNPDNFQLICPNCDSQQDTFGGKNYGKGRKSRGLPQYG